MLMSFDAIMHRVFGMHQHLIEILKHTTANPKIYVQRRKICEINNEGYLYRCGVSYEQEEFVPPLEELMIV